MLLMILKRFIYQLLFVPLTDCYEKYINGFYLKEI